MYSKSDNIEIVISSEEDEALKELFDSLKVNIKIIVFNSGESVFNYLHELSYKCHKINLNHL